jgi:hypothetical protein
MCEPPGFTSPSDAPAMKADAETIDATMIDARPDALVRDASRAAIAWKATTTTTIAASAPASAVTIAAPSPLAAGDVLVAVIAMGSTGEALVPAFTAPTGWTLIRQTNRNADSALAVYWHAVADAANETATYTWMFNESIEGVAWISDYTGVSTSAPVDAENGTLDATATTAYPAPTVTTTTVGAMIVLTYAGHDAGTQATWTAAAGTTKRAGLNDGTTRSGLSADTLWPTASTIPAYTAAASTSQEYALMHTLALRPAP